MSEQITTLKDRIIQYHIQLSVTCLLQDQDAGHWHSSRPFHEVVSMDHVVAMCNLSLFTSSAVCVCTKVSLLSLRCACLD